MYSTRKSHILCLTCQKYHHAFGSFHHFPLSFPQRDFCPYSHRISPKSDDCGLFRVFCIRPVTVFVEFWRSFEVLSPVSTEFSTNDRCFYSKVPAQDSGILLPCSAAVWEYPSAPDSPAQAVQQRFTHAVMGYDIPFTRTILLARRRRPQNFPQAGLSTGDNRPFALSAPERSEAQSPNPCRDRAALRQIQRHLCRASSA